MSSLPSATSSVPAREATTSGEHLWLTAQEFLAQVEAHRVARLKELATPKPPSGPRVIARVYQLNPHLRYVRKLKIASRPEVSHE